MKTTPYLFIALFVLLATTLRGQQLQPITSAATGQVIHFMPVADGWQVQGPKGSGQPYLTGPQGIRVSSLPAENYYYDCSPQHAQILQQQGQAVVPPVALSRILQESLAPQIQQMGGRLLRQYAVPQVLATDRSLNELVVQANGFQFQGVDLLATEWESRDGSRSLILLSQLQIRSRKGFAMWQLSIEELEAPAATFEQAVQTYLAMLAKRQVDRQAVLAQGQARRRQHEAKMAQDQAVWNERSRSSAIAHNQRMAANQAAFDATQATHRETVNAISQGSMNGYWSRSAASDRMQHNTVNMVREEQTMVNPYTGQPVQVQQGYRRTFVDPDGNYYQTDDMFFQPQQQAGCEYYREVGGN